MVFPSPIADSIDCRAGMAENRLYHHHSLSIRVTIKLEDY